MKKIRDAQAILGFLEGGQLMADLSTEITTTAAKLKELANIPKKKVKGKLTLSLDFEVQDGVLTIDSAIATKLPKESRRNTMCWVLDDGSLSTEHPQQADMFAGPREARAAE